MPSALSKTATHIPGLDEVLAGGIPLHGLTVIAGGPGGGKTIFGLEWIVRSALDGVPGIFLTFEEHAESLRTYCRGFGWDIDELEQKGLVTLISVRLPPTALFSGEFDLEGTLSILHSQADAKGAQRLVIDAPDVLFGQMIESRLQRQQIHGLYDWIREAGITTVMTQKVASSTAGGDFHDFAVYLADCVILLDQRVNEQISTRRLRILKYRGSRFGRNEYPFGVSERGVRIIPITQANLRHRELGPPQPTGISDFDPIMGGGFRRSSCNLISGRSGTGKTTFVCSFALASADRDERVLYLDFEESWDALRSCMDSSGIRLQPAHDSGKLRVLSTMPESQGIEEHLIDAFDTIIDFNPDSIIVDAISACRRMGSEQAAFDYLIRLIDFCKDRGITSLLTTLISSANSTAEVSGMDLSSIIDTIVVLTNVEKDREFQRELRVLKSRGQRHSARVHPFHITDRGIVFDPEAQEVVE